MKFPTNIILIICNIVISYYSFGGESLPTGNLAAPLKTKAGKTISIKPFTTTVNANSLIVRCKVSTGVNYLGPVTGTLIDGNFKQDCTLIPISPMLNRANTDFEFVLGKNVKLTPQTQLRLKFGGVNDLISVYAVLPVIFHKNDLSQGIDFETPERCGNWIAYNAATVKRNDTRGLSGKYCLRADWPSGNDMISILPGERDWRKYKALRLTVANPTPGVDGQRNRNCFIYDGKTVIRPSAKDSLSSGNISLLQEAVKTFTWDLELAKKNNPKIDFSNIRCFQIFWSSTRCGHTTFYIDDIKLLTQEDLDAEQKAKYFDRLQELKSFVSNQKKGNPELIALVKDIEKRFNAGERESLNLEFARANELKVIENLRINAPLRILSASAADKVMRDEMPAKTGFPIKISAAGNERESFQLVLAPFRKLKNVTVSAGDLECANRSTIAAKAVEINPIAFVEVRACAFNYKDARPGMWPDVLLNNQTFDLSVRLQPYMVTVAVPENQPAGVYQGSLTVRADGIEAQTVKYSLRVYDFSLPVKGKCKTWFSLSYRPKDKALRYKIYDKYFEYRLNPTGMYNYITKRDCKTLGPSTFTPLEDDIEYCLNKGMNFMTIGMLIDRPAPDPYFFDEAYIKTVNEWISQNKPILKKHGVWDMVHVNGFDEIMHKGGAVTIRQLKEARKICAAIKKAHPDIKIANIGNVMEISNNLMDTWFTDPVPRKRFAEIQEKGGFVGFYWAYQDPSFMLDQPGIAPRLCAWLAYKEGAEGLGYYSTYRNYHWQVPLPKFLKRPTATVVEEDEVPANPPCGLDWKRDRYNIEGTMFIGRNGDGILFHPGPGKTLLGSQRLTNIRDGIEDFEYFKILETFPGNHKKLLNISDDFVTVRQGDYTTDVSKVQARRDAIASAIETAQKRKRLQ